MNCKVLILLKENILIWETTTIQKESISPLSRQAQSHVKMINF